jgi:hypothetical protein
MKVRKASGAKATGFFFFYTSTFTVSAYSALFFMGSSFRNLEGAELEF